MMLKLMRFSMIFVSFVSAGTNLAYSSCDNLTPQQRLYCTALESSFAEQNCTARGQTAILLCKALRQIKSVESCTAIKDPSARAMCHQLEMGMTHGQCPNQGSSGSTSQFGELSADELCSFGKYVSDQYPIYKNSAELLKLKNKIQTTLNDTCAQPTPNQENSCGPSDSSDSIDHLKKNLTQIFPDNLGDSSEVCSHQEQIQAMALHLIPALEKIRPDLVNSNSAGQMLQFLSRILAAAEKTTPNLDQPFGTEKNYKFSNDPLLNFELRVDHNKQFIVDFPDIVLGKGGNKTVYLSFDLAQSLINPSKSNSRSPMLASTQMEHPRIEKALHLEEFEIHHRLSGSPGIVQASQPKVSDLPKDKYVTIIGTQELYSMDLTKLAINLTRSPVRLGAPEMSEEQKTQIRNKVAVDALQGLVSLKRAGVAHGDIKPDNLMVRTHSNGDIEAGITDFGTAYPFTNFEALQKNVEESAFNTAYYTAPEMPKYFAESVANDDESAIPSDHPLVKSIKDGKLDVWAMGFTLLNLKTGKNAGCDPQNRNKYGLPMLIGSINNYEDLWKTCKIPEFKNGPPQDPYDNLVYRMLNPDPEQRISAENALREFQQLYNQTHVEKRFDFKPRETSNTYGNPSSRIKNIQNRLFKAQ